MRPITALAIALIIGVYGFQDSGKTTFVEELVEGLVGKGYRVSSLKHSSKPVEVDEEGKDTWRHARAGSDPVVLYADGGMVLFAGPGPDVQKAVDILQEHWGPDVVIVEGLKTGPYPKIAVGDIEPTEGTVLTNPSVEDAMRHIESEVAVERAMRSIAGLDCGKCGSSCSEMARLIARGEKRSEDCVELAARDVVILAGGTRLPVGAFVAEIVERTVRGMLSSLKGYSPGGGVEIRLPPTDDATKDGDTDA
jgi:molybdopterin-guanine dinucleotide biosynthesis protein B